eukprot:3343982-Rhodomonas_salina.1
MSTRYPGLSTARCCSICTTCSSTTLLRGLYHRAASTDTQHKSAVLCRTNLLHVLYCVCCTARAVVPGRAASTSRAAGACRERHFLLAGQINSFSLFLVQPRTAGAKNAFDFARGEINAVALQA